MEVPLNSNDMAKTGGSCSDNTDILELMWMDNRTNVNLTMEFMKSKHSNFSLSSVMLDYSVMTENKTSEWDLFVWHQIM